MIVFVAALRRSVIGRISDAGRRAGAVLAAVWLIAAAAMVDGGASLAQTINADAALEAYSDPDRTEIVISGGQFDPIPIALPRFRASDPAYEDVAVRLSDVVAANLQRSGLFTVIGGDPLDSIDVPPDIDAWTARGAAALIAGDVTVEPDGRLGVRFRLWDLKLTEQRQQLKLLSSPTGWRRVAHKVADKVYQEMTGEEPYFDTRIVFVEERGSKEERRKRLAIMDSDGANLTYLTDDANLVLTPRFSPVSQEITFVSDEGGLPEIYLLNLTTERKERLGSFPGMSFAPRFSPDGERVVMSFSSGGATDIYLLDLATRVMRRLTNSPGIDTAPSFAPDGSKIAFESDRGATQQIYVMDPDGSNQQRISFGEGSYGTPVWSPKGDLIAFTRRVRGQFYIGVMRPDGTEERLLTTSYLDEGPTWAPNGRVIMFFREPPGSDGAPQLFTVDVFGGGEQPVPTKFGASDPAWSPLLDK